MPDLPDEYRLCPESLLPAECCERFRTAHLEPSIQRALTSIDVLINKFSGNEETADILRSVARGGVPDDDSELRIKFPDQVRSLIIPGRRRDGFDSLREIFGVQSYEHLQRDVDTVFDLGAFVGIASLYLKSICQNARLICVEPIEDNLAYLRRNLADYLMRDAIVVPHAISSRYGPITCKRVPGTSMANSISFNVENSVDANLFAVPLWALHPEGRYGIKIDIEGAEFELEDSACLLANAQWIVGELHYGAHTKSEHSWLRRLLTKHFALHLDDIRISWQCGSFLAAQNFTAISTHPSLHVPSDSVKFPG
jgi:methyltransferase, FkbM family